MKYNLGKLDWTAIPAIIFIIMIVIVVVNVVRTCADMSARLP